MTIPEQPVLAVIGGSGFVGGAVLGQLRRAGRAAVNIDLRAASDGSATRRADLRDASALTAALAGCDAALFLAAEWRDDVRPTELYYAVNVDGARNFVAAARATGLKRCVFTSSVSIYGPTTHEVGEAHPPAPINDYGRSKLAAEAVLREWAASDPEVALVIVRPTVIFGPGNRGNVWNLLNQMANGPFVMIGDGTNRKSMAAVANVAAFLLHRLDAGPGVHVYNYADKPDLDMNALVARVRARLGQSGGGVRVPRALAMAGAGGFDLAGRLLGRSFGITGERVFKFCANTQYSADAAWATGFVPPVALTAALDEVIAVEFCATRRAA